MMAHLAHVHHLGVHPLVRHLLDYVSHDAEVLTAEHIERARLPQPSPRVYLVAQLGAVAGEAGHRARRGLDHLLVIRVAHQQHHVLLLVVGRSAPGRLVHVGQFAEGEQCLKVLPIFFA